LCINPLLPTSCTPACVGVDVRPNRDATGFNAGSAARIPTEQLWREISTELARSEGRGFPEQLRTDSRMGCEVTPSWSRPPPSTRSANSLPDRAPRPVTALSLSGRHTCRG